MDSSRHRRAATEFGRLVDGTSPDQLGDTTPCTEFTVRDVINHVTGGADDVRDRVRARVRSRTTSSAAARGRHPRRRLRARRTPPRSTRSGPRSATPGALDGNVDLPFGEMPREAALAIAVFDVDGARAGTSPRPPASRSASPTTEVGSRDSRSARELQVDELRDGSEFGRGGRHRRRRAASGTASSPTPAARPDRG